MTIKILEEKEFTTRLSDIALMDNIFTSGECQYIIDFFEKNTGSHEIIDDAHGATFTQCEIDADLQKKALPKILYAINEYRKYFPQIPPAVFMEKIRVKKYEPNSEDEFKIHCDSINEETSTRYLAILVYLNDIEGGGETEFPGVMTITPERGKALIFPPFWTHPHQGNKVTGSKPKYILSTYLRYS